MFSNPPKTNSEELRPRNFTIAHGLILIAGIALALGLIRSATYIKHSHFESDFNSLSSPVKKFTLPYYIIITYDYMLPIASILSVVVLCLQLAHLRMRRGALIRRIGSSACLSAVLGIAVGMPILTIRAWLLDRVFYGLIAPPTYWTELCWNAFHNLTQNLGLVVVVAGLLEHFRETPKLKPDWLDWSARVIGLIWVLLTLAPIQYF